MERWGYSGDQFRRFEYPIALANVRHPSSFTRANRDVKCLVDSGADVSGMPVRLLNRLGIASDIIPETTYDYDSKPRQQEFSWVTISLCGKRFGPIKIARLSNTSMPILGRDVLNQFVVTLNGPELTCEVE